MNKIQRTNRSKNTSVYRSDQIQDSAKLFLVNRNSKRRIWIRIFLLALVFILLLVLSVFIQREQKNKALLEYRLREHYMNVFVGIHSGLQKALIEDDNSFSLYWMSFDYARSQYASANAIGSSLSSMYPDRINNTTDIFSTVTESILSDIRMAFQFPPSPLEHNQKNDYQIIASFLEEELINTRFNSLDDYATIERCDEFLVDFIEIVASTTSPDFQLLRKTVSNIPSSAIKE